MLQLGGSSAAVCYFSRVGNQLGDPIVMTDASPFVQRFPTGRFPVQLAIAKIDTDERVAFSRILFSDKRVARWELAVDKGQQPLPIDSNVMYGYGVDAGMGLFIDQAARDAFEQLRTKEEKIWDRVFMEETDKHYRNTWHYVVYDFGQYSLASFSTGYGDGTYATYVGYDETGKVCRLLTDFRLVTWWE